jgi:hypothetical protein
VFDLEHYLLVFDTAKQEEYYEISILDGDGVILTSNNVNIMGRDDSGENYYLETMTGSHYIEDVYYSEADKIELFSISSPIKNPDTGEILGVLTVKMKTDLLNKITLDRTGLGKSGEAYLIGKDGYMLTESRYEDDVVLKRKIDSLGFQKCIADSQKNQNDSAFSMKIATYRNYKGMTVIGTDAYIPEMKWCLLTEIEEKEAVGLLREDLLFAGFKIAILALALMVVFILIANRFLLKK